MGRTPKAGIGFASVVFLMFMGGVLAADDAYPIQAVVFELTRSSAPEKKTSFHGAISAAIRLEIERAGLPVISRAELPDTFPIQGVEDREKIDESVLFELAGRVKADFVLACTYTARKTEIQMHFGWYDVQENRMTASTVQSGSLLDLNLDLVLSKGIKEILLQVVERLAALPRKTPEKETETAGAKGEFGRAESESADDRFEAEEVEKVEQPGAKPAGPDTEPAAIPEQEEQGRNGKLFELSLGFAPFLAIGNTSDYFTVGLAPCLSSGFRFKLPVGVRRVLVEPHPSAVYANAYRFAGEDR